MMEAKHHMYLLDQSKDYAPGFWSKSGRDLLHEMLAEQDQTSYKQA